jgi:drug/metabolite transporter (DMT)-like permease
MMNHRALRIAAGTGLALAGVAMLVLPGPGLLTLLAAAKLLADDVPAARRLTGPVERWLGREPAAA